MPLPITNWLQSLGIPTELSNLSHHIYMYTFDLFWTLSSFVLCNRIRNLRSSRAAEIYLYVTTETDKCTTDQRKRNIYITRHPHTARTHTQPQTHTPHARTPTHQPTHRTHPPTYTPHAPHRHYCEECNDAKYSELLLECLLQIKELV